MRIRAMQRIKDSGKAGVSAVALTAERVLDRLVPFCDRRLSGSLATGSFPDFACAREGKAAIGADAFIFINFARDSSCRRAHRVRAGPGAVGRREHRQEVRRRRAGRGVDKDRPGRYGSRARVLILCPCESSPRLAVNKTSLTKRTKQHLALTGSRSG